MLLISEDLTNPTWEKWIEACQKQEVAFRVWFATPTSRSGRWAAQKGALEPLQCIRQISTGGEAATDQKLQEIATWLANHPMSSLVDIANETGSAEKDVHRAVKRFKFRMDLRAKDGLPGLCHCNTDILKARTPLAAEERACVAIGNCGEASIEELMVWLGVTKDCAGKALTMLVAQKRVVKAQGVNGPVYRLNKSAPKKAHEPDAEEMLKADQDSREPFPETILKSKRKRNPIVDDYMASLGVT